MPASSSKLSVRSRAAGSKVRIFVGQYVIDVHEGVERAYYAVSKDGSNDIVALGDEPTMEAAEKAARWFALTLANKEDTKSAAASDDDSRAS